MTLVTRLSLSFALLLPATAAAQGAPREEPSEAPARPTSADPPAPAGEGATPNEADHAAAAAPYDDVIIAPPQSPPDPASLVPPGGVPVVGQPEPQASQPPRPEPSSPEPAPEPIRYSVGIHIRAAFPAESGFDQTMSGFGYSGVRLEPVGYLDVALPTVEWLWLGARAGLRGRNWTHAYRDSAVVSGGDLLLTAQVRFLVGTIFELGALVGGGFGAMVVQLNGVSSDQVVGRVELEVTAAFRVGSNFTIGPRFGWSYFQWDNIYEQDSLDIGGGFFGIALEGRE